MPQQLLTVPHAVRFFACLVGLWFSISPQQVHAHASGENYVWLNIESDHIAGRFEININDLKSKLGIDWTEHGETEAAAVAATAEEVQSYLRKHFSVSLAGQPLEIQFEKTGVFGEKQNYAQYFYRTATTEIPDKLTIRNDIFITDDSPLHRSLIVLSYNKKQGAEYGEENAIMAFGPHKPEQELDLNNLPALLKPFEFIWQAILHIWIGIDHILFLLALLLLAVVTREDGKWQGVKTFRSALWNVLKIVTVFTIAHSITLSLAALNLISAESYIVESLIALSIVLVAINNILPKFDEKKWLVIFFFGLFHGMGFASVMGELPFRTINLIKILLSFNVGVELGQLVIVAAVFPVIYLLRNQKFYHPVIVKGGSVVIGLIACFWFIERAFQLG